MMKHLCCIFLLTGFSIAAQPGRESTHWHFGSGLSLDFSSSPPTPGTSALHTVEGCASISDPNSGQLLFYTDGDTIWTRNNTTMPNGTGLYGGGGTSTQAALIIQQPEHENMFYVFTADQGGYGAPNKGVFYSIVDMSSGNGTVVEKNIQLTAPPTIEKLTGIKHCNGKDFWVITHSFLSNQYHAYLLNASGIAKEVISAVGFSQPNNGGTWDETIGSMKASPDGSKIATCISYYDPGVEVTDFDNETGSVSNPFMISYTGNPSPYGVSFSPDNSKLYVSQTYNERILQYDLSSGNASTIINSEITVASQYGFSGMQLASDGRIYVIENTDSVGCISLPDNAGLGCNYEYNKIRFSQGKCQLGLPNFVDSDIPLLNNAIVFPNIVTPNNDGVNDFIDLSSYPFKAVSFNVFNRWGNRIFSSADTKAVWQPSCVDGTYYYTLEYTPGCEIYTAKTKGFLTVIR